ncbi:hypothetical protein SAY86_028998 [Trapa natans]|uniref:Uncharacterized protein n=1 Tax=Trapa natans TaxID=22666 RepID=A0AAN7MDR0_TRANT|nr:hypothetical protein SAY86_028998 [Trapa natans]
MLISPVSSGEQLSPEKGACLSVPAGALHSLTPSAYKYTHHHPLSHSNAAEITLSLSLRAPFLSPPCSEVLLRCSPLSGRLRNSVMAALRMEDGEFWLPPQFLEDHLGCEDSDSSDLCSQMESMTGSGEDWSDEEDCLAGLSSKMVLSTIGDDVQKLHCDKYKSMFGSRSPKSTLRGVDDSFIPTQRLPPAAMHLFNDGRVAPMRMSEKVLPSEPIRITEKSDAYFFPEKSLSQQQLQAVQLQRMRQQQILLGQYRLPHRDPVGRQWLPHPQGHQKANHLSHQVERAGTMREVLSRPPGTRPCAGTGVFLPRQVCSQPEPRKKQGPALAAPSPVLIPAKVVQALHLSYEIMGAQSQQHLKYSQTGRLTPDNGGPRRSLREDFAEPRPDYSHEIKLPQEWTY